MIKAASAKERATERCREISKKALALMGEKGVEVPEIVFLPDGPMRVLEKTYMKKEKKVVDVLSFPEPSGFPNPQTKKRILGQIFLNWDLNKNDKDRLKELVIHGTLHLLGYRHEAKKDILEMEKTEESLCRRISL